MTRSRQRRRSSGGSSNGNSKPTRERSQATHSARPAEAVDVEAGGEEDVYAVDCVSIEQVAEAGGEAGSGQEIVAEKINVGDNERIVIFRRSDKKSCSRYVLKDIFD